MIIWTQNYFDSVSLPKARCFASHKMGELSWVRGQLATCCLDWPSLVDVYLYGTTWNSWTNMFNTQNFLDLCNWIRPVTRWPTEPCSQYEPFVTKLHFLLPGAHYKLATRKNYEAHIWHIQLNKFFLNQTPFTTICKSSAFIRRRKTTNIYVSWWV